MAESVSGSMGGSVATALRVLDRHVRAIVQHAISRHAIQDPDTAGGVADLHDRIARLLHEISLEHGTDAMSTAADYAAEALEAGSIYPGDELERFLREVSSRVRATSKDLTKSTPFGG